MSRMMKDSGIEWIGQIPDAWSVRKLKSIAKIQTGNTPDKTNENYYTDDEGLMWVKSDNLNGIVPIRNTVERLTEEGSKVARIAPKGSTLVCCIGSIGKYGVVDTDVAYNQQINAVTFDNEIVLSKFGTYLIAVSESQHWLYANGNVLKILNNEGQGKIIYAIPKLAEQKKIAEFLDEKISEVDIIISKTKASIDEYKKYRKAIVIKAVTKGLHTNVAMKQTDSDWIGEIPAHWDYVRIQRLFETVDERNDDENALLLSLYTALGVKPRNELEEKGNKASTVINYKKVQKNDVIVNKLLAWMGAIGYSDYEGVTSPDYDVYRAGEGANVVRNYYNEYFRNTCFNGDCYKYGHGIMLMRWRTYPEEFLRIRVPNPPLAEQQEIANYLAEKCGEIDVLIAKKEAFVEEMETYKKTLIYDYVTGKKEVV